MIPTEMKMEDLSGLGKLLPTFFLNFWAHGDNNINRKTALHRRLYIRFVDKAVDEYQEARNWLRAQIEEGQRSAEEMPRDGGFIFSIGGGTRRIYMFKFVDHMENCISTVRRILRFLVILKRNQDGLLFSRTIRKQIEQRTPYIRAVRDAVEHMDKEIQKDRIQENATIMLTLTDTQDGIVIGGQSLKFSTLSMLIKQLHELGKNMAAWRSAYNA
jgi:hypothetical protein